MLGLLRAVLVKGFFFLGRFFFRILSPLKYGEQGKTMGRIMNK